MAALLGILLIGSSYAATWEKVSIYLNGSDSLDIKTGVLDKSADVEAYFVDSMESTGWGVLQVQINNNNPNKNAISDKQRSYASGYAEGMLTAERIYQQYHNMQVTDFWDFTNGPSQQLEDWIKQQREWENNMISKNPNDDIVGYCDRFEDEGTIIIITLNMDKQSVCYKINGKDYGYVKAKCVKKGEKYRLAVTLMSYTENSAQEIVLL